MHSHGTGYPISDSSSSDGTGSTPNTPPSPVAVPTDPYAVYVEPQVVSSSPSPTPKRTPRKNVSPANRLGAIDEDTAAVSPDPAPRNTYRLFNGMNHTKLFQLAFPLHLSKRPPPPKIYDDIEGPKGEKFRDVRNNAKNGKVGDTRKKRKIICAALVALVVIVIVIVVLLAVLLTRKKSSNNGDNSDSSGGSSSSSNTSQVFPAGTYSIPSYLTETSTACTSNSATWRCYPYQTYNSSATASFSVLTWLITSNTSNPNATNAGYSISSTDTLFSYPFQNRPLTLVNKGTANEAYTFTYTYTKTVFPTVALTSDGATTRCYFNNTILTAHLYTKKAMENGLQNMTMPNSGASQLWPYALDFEESSEAGSNVPNCYKYVSGVDGARVDVSTLTQNSAMCDCNYQNYGV